MRKNTSENIQEQPVELQTDLEQESKFIITKSIPALVIRMIVMQVGVALLILLLAVLTIFFLPMVIVPILIAIALAVVIDLGFSAYFIWQWVTTVMEVHTFKVIKQNGVLVSKPGKVFLTRGNNNQVHTYILETYQKAEVRKGPFGSTFGYGDILLIDESHNQIDILDLVDNPEQYLERIQTIIDMSSTNIQPVDS